MLVLLFLLCADNELTPAERAQGWTLLFDGSTTKGWREVTGLEFPAESWIIEDHCLKAVLHPDAFQDLRTEAEFESFDLRFAWKIAPAGNSGVKYFVVKTDRWAAKSGKGFMARARGSEYQLTDDAANPDALSNPKHSAGALYGVIAPAKSAMRPAGEFNESRLLVRDKHVEHWLNGVLVVSYEVDAPRRSFIALQNHASEVWFRNIKVRVLRHGD